MGVLLAACVALLIAGLLMTSVFILRNYAGGGADPAAQVQAPDAAALALVQSSDCLRCHLPARKAVGPSWQAIAERHASRPDAVDFLAQKIRQGSVGDWGRVIMPRHPQIDEADARAMAQWVLRQVPAASAPVR